MRAKKSIYQLILIPLLLLFLHAESTGQQDPEQIIFEPSEAAMKLNKMNIALIPTPKSIEFAEGFFRLDKDFLIFLPQDVEKSEFLAALSLRRTIKKKTDSKVTLDRLPEKVSAQKGIELKIEPRMRSNKEAYTLTITPELITITGRSGAGLFYGIQTLKQLIENCNKKIPCLKIKDEPDFEVRGFYHDICRGKVPKLKTLKELVDRLASLKINQFQLYVEHTFAFKFDPSIAEGLSPITPEEILLLDEYCKDRHIDFVPSIQSFGHMGHILSLPQYRHLAEIEKDKSWDEFTWRERMQGLTIDSINPEGQELLRNMYNDFLPLFSSKLCNVCSDETYDLAKGKNAEIAARTRPGQLYLRHIKYLRSLCDSHGKRMMFWGDVIKRHPNEIRKIPKDAILLNWGYRAKQNYESTKIFKDAGLDFYVCPGTSGWNRILNGMNNADLNIRRFAKTGKKYGAQGLLNTDWGDFGHYNLLACSLHGIALGAEVGWYVNGSSQESFDKAWSKLFFGDPKGKLTKALKELCIPGDERGTWISFYHPIEDDEFKKVVKEKDGKEKTIEIYTLEDGKKLISDAETVEKILLNLKDNAEANSQDIEELLSAARTSALFGRKILLAKRLNKGGDKKLPADLMELARDIKESYPNYKKLWLARNKQSNLKDIERAYKELIANLNETAKSMDK